MKKVTSYMIRIVAKERDSDMLKDEEWPDFTETSLPRAGDRILSARGIRVKVETVLHCQIDDVMIHELHVSAL